MLPRKFRPTCYLLIRLTHIFLVSFIAQISFKRNSNTVVSIFLHWARCLKYKCKAVSLSQTVWKDMSAHIAADTSVARRNTLPSNDYMFAKMFICISASPLVIQCFCFFPSFFFFWPLRVFGIWTIINLAMGRDTLWIHCLPCKSIIPVGGRNHHITAAAAEYWAVVPLSSTKLSTGLLLCAGPTNLCFFYANI